MNSIIKPRVVLDTNIYISAIISSGKPRSVLELAQKGKVELLISDHIISEIERVLRTKLHRPDWQIDIILTAIRIASKTVSPNFKVTIIKEHDPDNRIIECAMAGNAEYIVSGDRRHILKLIKYKGISIVSPDEFLSNFG